MFYEQGCLGCDSIDILGKFGILLCLCKESINWRDKKCTYDFEKSMESQKKDSMDT